MINFKKFKNLLNILCLQSLHKPNIYWLMTHHLCNLCLYIWNHVMSFQCKKAFNVLFPVQGPWRIRGPRPTILQWPTRDRGSITRAAPSRQTLWPDIHVCGTHWTHTCNIYDTRGHVLSKVTILTGPPDVALH